MDETDVTGTRGPTDGYSERATESIATGDHDAAAIGGHDGAAAVGDDTQTGWSGSP
ncbi:hypothetical protein [Halorubrum tibetense]|uniref:Uncharacterized protein n=1 Tax=Halorubrum tibetense TaxID=175631 RepID=A0ABD5SAQ8_9EURY